MTLQEPFILYIEDERPVLDLVRQTLHISGLEVTGAGTGEEGLTLMHQRPPDLLLLDLMMPGVNGWHIYEQMKADETLAQVPVIVITAKVPEHGLTIVDGLPPVNDYITKPFGPERLLRSVQGLLPD
jgi:DNA-binding response OmpR family regulator